MKEFILPEKWCIKANNEDEAKIIVAFIDTLSRKPHLHSWEIEDAMRYYLRINNGEYHGGNVNIMAKFKEISFDEFKKHVFKSKPIKQEKITLNVEILNKLLK